MTVATKVKNGVIDEIEEILKQACERNNYTYEEVRHRKGLLIFCFQPVIVRENGQKIGTGEEAAIKVVESIKRELCAQYMDNMVTVETVPQNGSYTIEATVYAISV